jgi:hypothetical protein
VRPAALRSWRAASGTDQTAAAISRPKGGCDAVEGNEHHVIGAALVHRGLQTAERRHTVTTERAQFAVEVGCNRRLAVDAEREVAGCRFFLDRPPGLRRSRQHPAH